MKKKEDASEKLVRAAQHLTIKFHGSKPSSSNQRPRRETLAGSHVHVDVAPWALVLALWILGMTALVIILLLLRFPSR
jgi:hypothetical protein